MYIFEGRISSSGFASGDRIVIGDWEHSPLGSFTNVMWAKPDGTRVYVTNDEDDDTNYAERNHLDSNDTHAFVSVLAFGPS